MGWWKTAKPGDFIVAVKDVTTCKNGSDAIYRGKVYEIKEVFVAGAEFYQEGRVAIRLRGQSNGWKNGFEGAWGAGCFRPVQTLPASITSSLTEPVSPWGVHQEETA